MEQKEAESKFKDIAQAYDVLSNADKRAVYDRHGEEGLQAGGGGGPSTGGMPPGFGGGFTRSGPGGVRVVFSSTGGGLGGMSGGRAEEIFQSFFSGGDPFVGFGFGDDDFVMRRTRARRPMGRAPVVRDSERIDLLPKRTVVKLCGLTNETLNGSVGQVVECSRLLTPCLKQPAS